MTDGSRLLDDEVHGDAFLDAVLCQRLPVLEYLPSEYQTDAVELRLKRRRNDLAKLLTREGKSQSG